jgi:hypothetical protein
MLRQMQADVNKRTEAFKKKHPDAAKLTDMDRDELQGLQRDQKDVSELLDELNRPAGEPAAKEGENK